MEGTKLLTEVFSHSTLSDFLGSDTHSQISIGLPEDALGFWLTQGIPFGLLLFHVISSFLDDRVMGRCFVTNISGGELPQSQELFITEFCMDQGHTTDCGIDWPNGCTPGLTKCNVGSANNSVEPWTNEEEGIDLINSLFLYRYHLWLIIIGIIIRCLPGVIWKVFRKAHIHNAIKSLATVAEFQHVVQGVYRTCPDEQVPSWVEYMNKIGSKELELRVTRSNLFYQYTLKKVADILLDGFLLVCLVWVLTHHTVFHRLIFVCDLHRLVEMLLICSTVGQRFVPCTISYGIEFIIVIWTLTAVYAIDLAVQLVGIICFTKILHRVATWVKGGAQSDPLFLDSFLEKELELNKSVHPRAFYTTLMNSPNNLYLIGQLFQQSNVTHGHFLKMISETMKEELRPFFKSMKMNPPENQSTTTPRDISSETEDGGHLLVQSFDSGSHFLASGDTENLLTAS